MADTNEIEIRITDNAFDVAKNLKELFETLQKGGNQSADTLGELITALGNADRATGEYGQEADVLTSKLRIQLQQYKELALMLDWYIQREGAESESAMKARLALDQKGLAAQKTAQELAALVQQSDRSHTSFGQFADGLGNVIGQFKAMGGPIATVAGGLQNTLGVVNLAQVGMAGLAGAAIGLATSLKRSGDEFVAYTTRLQTIADQTGIDIEFVGRFAQAADDASVSLRGTGVSVETVGAALNKLNIQLGKGMNEQGQFEAGGGRAAKVLQDMGISAVRVAEALDRPGELLLLLADAFAQTESKSQRASNAIALFGASGRDLLPLLEKGRAGVKGMMEAVDASLAPTSESAKKAAEYATSVDNMEDSFAALTQRIGGPVVGALNDFAKGMNNTFSSVEGGMKLAEIALRSGGRVTEEYKIQLVAFHDQLAKSSNKADQLTAKVMESGPVYQDAKTYVDNLARAHDNLVRANENVMEQQGALSILISGMQNPWDALRKKIEENAKAHEDAAAAAEKHKLAIEGIGNAVGKPWKPPSKQEEAGNIFRLATGQITPEEFEKGQFEGVLTNLYGKNQISKDQLVNIANAYDKGGAGGPQIAAAIAAIQPGARKELAGFIQTLKGQEVPAGVVGPLVQGLGGSVRQYSGVVQPTKEQMLKGQQLVDNVTEAKQEFDRAVWSEPRYKQMGKTPEWAKANVTDKELALLQAEKEGEKGKQMMQPHTVTWSDFDPAMIRGMIATAGVGGAKGMFPNVPLGGIPMYNEDGTPNVLRQPPPGMSPSDYYGHLPVPPPPTALTGDRYQGPYLPVGQPPLRPGAGAGDRFVDTVPARDRIAGPWEDIGPQVKEGSGQKASTEIETAVAAAESATARIEPLITTWQDFNEAVYNRGRGGKKGGRPGVAATVDTGQTGGTTGAEGGTVEYPTPPVPSTASSAGASADAGTGLGGALVAGAAQGVTDGGEALRVSLVGAFDAAVDAVKAKYQIASPSRYMQENVGAPLLQGVANGIANNQQLVVTAMTDTFTVLSAYVGGDEAVALWTGMGQSLMTTLAGAIKDNSWRLQNELKEAMRASIVAMVEFALNEARMRVR